MKFAGTGSGPKDALVIVMATCKNVESSTPELRRCFTHEVHIGMPDEDQRLDMLHHYLGVGGYGNADTQNVLVFSLTSCDDVDVVCFHLGWNLFCPGLLWTRITDLGRSSSSKEYTIVAKKLINRLGTMSFNTSLFRFLPTLTSMKQHRRRFKCSKNSFACILICLQKVKGRFF